jgi:hypothetical protein
VSFIHIVSFQWKDSAPADVDAVVSALTALVPQLPGIESYRCGPDVGHTPASYDFAVVGTFTGRTEFENYRDHPEHQRILRELIVPHLENRVVVQLET